ncbi:Sodium:potassium:calcium exchanger [Paragonimus heterotremus]|uniref:Sodium:potassium:calcium exchanger n=1 Tax=Paragonimus heterotremus TaxID=100268 RepID=A0A8J4T9Z7_9TREM|nr:Sodium:potassium:calcium exchanger [Paragonimus heterotremus]
MLLSRKSGSTLQFKLICLLIYGVLFGMKFFLLRMRYSSVPDLEPFLPTSEANELLPPGSIQGDPGYEFHRHLLTIRIHRPSPASNCTPLAIDNFPSDLFRQSQRQKGAVLLHIFGSVYMFIALAILCDDYFIPCLERICEALNLQPDVAGATFMAAGSSAPELATTLVGVFIAKDDIGLGAVVGSADFNIMLVVSVSALFARQVIYLNWWPLVRDCFFYLVSIVLLALVILDEHIYWYEAFIFLIAYAIYVAFMFFNPKVDEFWRVWCRNHPTCCPRAIHTEDEEQEIVQQHSGAFVHVDPGAEDTQLPAIQIQYERLTGEDKIPANAILDNPDAIPVVVQESKDPAATKVDLCLSELETQVCEPEESWFDTCFSPLRLPKLQGVRAKLFCCAILLVWPLRLVLCLTVPDVRKPRWRRLSASHWISFVMCCFWIGLFTVIMMWMITIIGVTFHIPDTIMGLTFIAAGSSVPDAIASILVVREGEGDMAVSNAVGSNVFDILVCMGLPWLLKCMFTGAPVIIYSRGLLYAVLTLFATVLFLLGATHMNRWRLTKPYGIVLLVGYFVVLVFSCCYELNLFGVVHLPECPFLETS